MCRSLITADTAKSSRRRPQPVNIQRLCADQTGGGFKILQHSESHSLGVKCIRHKESCTVFHIVSARGNIHVFKEMYVFVSPSSQANVNTRLPQSLRDTRQLLWTPAVFTCQSYISLPPSYFISAYCFNIGHVEYAQIVSAWLLSHTVKILEHPFFISYRCGSKPGLVAHTGTHSQTGEHFLFVFWGFFWTHTFKSDT